VFGEIVFCCKSGTALLVALLLMVLGLVCVVVEDGDTAMPEAGLPFFLLLAE
jgi:hypothetical protein